MQIKSLAITYYSKLYYNKVAFRNGVKVAGTVLAGQNPEKVGETSKAEKSSGYGSTGRKISQSLWRVFCSALMSEIEKTVAAGESDRGKLLEFILKEHQRVSRGLN
jgi:hypothetical protein